MQPKTAFKILVIDAPVLSSLSQINISRRKRTGYRSRLLSASRGEESDQLRLNAEGLLDKPGGLFDVETELALRGFQQNNRLVTNGVVGVFAWEATRSLQPTCKPKRIAELQGIATSPVVSISYQNNDFFAGSIGESVEEKVKKLQQLPRQEQSCCSNTGSFCIHLVRKSKGFCNPSANTTGRTVITPAWGFFMRLRREFNSLYKRFENLFDFLNTAELGCGISRCLFQTSPHFYVGIFWSIKNYFSSINHLAIQHV